MGNRIMSTQWVEDPSLEAPEGHRWMRPAPEDCPDCLCHTARVCRTARWGECTPPQNADGTPYLKACPCQQKHRGRP